MTAFFWVRILPCVFMSSALARGRTIEVDGAGRGQYRSPQQAIDSIRLPNTEPTIIHLRAGVYAGPIVLPRTDANFTFVGDGEDKSIITFDLNVHDAMPPGPASAYKGTGFTVLSDNFRAKDLTFQNTSGDHGQAMALRIDGDRAILDHCKLLGWQDTLLINNGRMYFHDCTIAGRVDFIYGSATAVFDHCDVHSRNGGHITAASTPSDHPFGFVFMDCTLTGDTLPWTTAGTTRPSRVTPLADLGRPWRPYAAVTFLRCIMGAHIKPTGWDNWRNRANEKTARYAEYGSTGPGADPKERARWSKQLTTREADAITVGNVLSGRDQWNPVATAAAGK